MACAALLLAFRLGSRLFDERTALTLRHPAGR